MIIGKFYSSFELEDLRKEFSTVARTVFDFFLNFHLQICNLETLLLGFSLEI